MGSIFEYLPHLPRKDWVAVAGREPYGPGPLRNPSLFGFEHHDPVTVFWLPDQVNHYFVLSRHNIPRNLLDVFVCTQYVDTLELQPAVVEKLSLCSNTLGRVVRVGRAIYGITGTGGLLFDPTTEYRMLAYKIIRKVDGEFMCGHIIKAVSRIHEKYLPILDSHFTRLEPLANQVHQI